MRPVYPWSAVVGQEPLKHALVLCAIDPAIGGVLVQGPRGIAKTTLARALGQLVSGAFVELPLGASEERVTGSLDLQSALRDGEVTFSPGLLARAHEGVLYVDEVNLLPDALVDLLLDAAASGYNTVERDGISHAHAARFVLIGTMNPDEGELRPQLTDRFGLSVRADGELTADERAEIVRRRLAFDAEPAAFLERFAEAQQSLLARCHAARARLASIPLSGSGLQLVSERCHREHVEGVRADLAMLRAARAHAAWHQRAQITTGDVEAVAELALAHRRRAAPDPSRSGPRGGASTPPAPNRSSGPGAPPATTPASGTAGMNDALGATTANDKSDAASPDPRESDPAHSRFGAVAPVPVQAAALPSISSTLLTPRGRDLELRRRGAARRLGARGQRAQLGKCGGIDWFATFACTRRPGFSDLRYRGRRAPSAELLVIALDCSGSMLRSGALARAKALVQVFEAHALRSGTRVALVTFHGREAELVLDAGESRPTRKRIIDTLAGGGGTPLRRALQQALALCASRRFALPTLGKRLLVLTDGRTRERISDLAHGARDVELAMIDCERGPVRIGRTHALAASVGASCVHIDELTARG